ncbi:MAG: helix-turn-helix domain-containing protein [Candidatus Aegiribacteria sp.]|nr:helix-turn-helix domain-containing protein [Candidatus Aegiribacteria sp.]MBD3295333.1 helix-turn-helix domain-containing protein [Candidatus Fermentibacteria bacterium]
MSHISKLVKHHRKRAGITQLELADLAGIGKTTVFDIEHGKSTVQVSSLLSVLKVLNMSIQVIGPFVSEYRKQSEDHTALMENQVSHV